MGKIDEIHTSREYSKMTEEYFKDKLPYSGEIKRGDVFYFDRGPTVGSEQRGDRPGIVVSNNVGNRFSDNVLVVYTTTQPKNNLPVHVDVLSMERKSVALCEQIHTLSTKKVVNKKGTLTNDEMKQIDKALIESLGIPIETLIEYILDKNASNEALKVETTSDCQQSPELIKVLAERDTYMILYNQLLENIMKR